MNVLATLVVAARARADALAPAAPAPPEACAARAGFAAAVAGRDRLAVIAEFKRRSPSRGPIAPGVAVADRIRAFDAAGAAAISVLTEPSLFGGSGADLRAAAAATALPLLCKDFVVDPRQVAEAAALGASAVLLIARILAPAQLQALGQHARALGLTALVEVHDRRELEAALAVDDAVIGINNRDLATLQVDLGNVERLLPHVPAGRIVVAESGYEDPARLRSLRGRVDGVLVGTALMAAADPRAFVEGARR